MNARLRADLYAAGITSPHLLAHCIDHATQRANNAPRLTPSRRYRRWKVYGLRVAVVAAAFAIYGVTQ